MRTICCLFVALVAFTPTSFSQKKPATKPAFQCQFEELFYLPPAASKQLVLQKAKSVFTLTNENIATNYIKNTVAKADSVLEEVYTYKIQSTTCFNGSTPTLKLVFANGKLYKAYVSSMFTQQQKAELSANFKQIRSVAKRHWPIEQMRKIVGTNQQGVGYAYFKTKNGNQYKNYCTVQYVEESYKAEGETGSAYLLELLWTNLAGSGLKVPLTK
jgi:hypothetical protein